MITRISYTRAQSIGTCGRAYRFRYIDRLEPVATSIAMPFGKAVHGPVTDYVIAHALSKPFDIMANFEEAWVKHTSDQQLKYPMNWDADSSYAAAKRLVELFPEAGEKAPLVAVLDQSGAPLVERWLVVPGPPGVEIELRIDFLVMDLRSGAIGVLDAKTTSAEHCEAFGSNALQLTTYQYAVDHAFASCLGPVANVGFMEFVKRKVPKGSKGQGPSIEPPTWYPRRSDEEVREMLTACANAARDIRDQRFHRPFFASFNSPCNLCDYARLCVHGDQQGYRLRTTSR